jgi:4-alpha-glucanotransferase
MVIKQIQCVYCGDFFDPSPRHKNQHLGQEVSPERVHLELIRLAMMSVANMVIVPMQDILGLGEEARMNRPATTEGNWQWRLLPEQLKPSVAKRLLDMTELYGRA